MALGSELCSTKRALARKTQSGVKVQLRGQRARAKQRGKATSEVEEAALREASPRTKHNKGKSNPRGKWAAESKSAKIVQHGLWQATVQGEGRRLTEINTSCRIISNIQPCRCEAVSRVQVKSNLVCQ